MVYEHWSNQVGEVIHVEEMERRKSEGVAKHGRYEWVRDKDYRRTVYIGRANRAHSLSQSKWRNPFHVGKDGTRDEVIAKYREYITAPEQRKLLGGLRELQGCDLACWCAPEPCHGDVLLELIAQMHTITDTDSLIAYILRYGLAEGTMAYDDLRAVLYLVDCEAVQHGRRHLASRSGLEWYAGWDGPYSDQLLEVVRTSPLVCMSSSGEVALSNLSLPTRPVGVETRVFVAALLLVLPSLPYTAAHLARRTGPAVMLPNGEPVRLAEWVLSEWRVAEEA